MNRTRLLRLELRPRFLLFVLVFMGFFAFGIGPSISAYQWPVKEPTYVTATFGEYRPGHLHNGVDFSVHGLNDRAARAIQRGVVERIFLDPNVFGLTVIVRHPDGRRSWYSHLNRVSDLIKNSLKREIIPHRTVYPSNPIRLRAGDPVGIVGASGRGFLHLHLVVQARDGRFLNPMGMFEPELPYEGELQEPTIYAKPVDAESWVNFSPSPAQFSPGETLDLYGTLDFDIQISQITPQGNTTLPREIELFRDGQKVAERNFESIPQTSGPNLLSRTYNLVQSNLGPTKFKLHVTSGKHSGAEYLTFTEPGAVGKLGFRVTGNAGRVRWYKFDYRVRRPGNPHDAERIEWPAGLRQFSGESNLSIELVGGRIWYGVRWDNLDEGSRLVARRSNGSTESMDFIHRTHGVRMGWWAPEFDQTETVSFRILNGSGELLDEQKVVLGNVSKGDLVLVDPTGKWSFQADKGMVSGPPLSLVPVTVEDVPPGLEVLGRGIVVEPNELPFRSALELTGRLSSKVDNPETVGLFRWDPVVNEWKSVSFKRGFSDREVRANLHQGGVFATFRVTSGPDLREPSPIQRGSILRFPLLENRVRLLYQDIRVFLDGDPINYKWNMDRQWLDVYLPEGAEGELVVRVENKAGFVDRWRGFVSEPRAKVSSNG